MDDRKIAINDLDASIRWIEHIPCYQFPGWLNVTISMRKTLELLKEQEARNQCLKTKCVVCPHCYNCDVDENGLLKEQEVPKQIVRKQVKRENPDGSVDYFAEWSCPHCGKVLDRAFDAPWIEFCYKERR